MLECYSKEKTAGLVEGPRFFRICVLFIVNHHYIIKYWRIYNVSL